MIAASSLNGHAAERRPLPTDALVERSLLRLFAEAHLVPGQVFEVDVNDIVLKLTVELPQGRKVQPEGPCEQGVYAAVVELERQHGRRVLAKEILKELRQVEDPWSDSAVWKALASLRHKGLLTNGHNARGYGTNPERNGES